MTCEEFEELSGAYALDAITAAERQAADTHLATCARCRALHRELRGVVTLLPLSVPQVNPPPELKERIFAAIRQGDAQSAIQPEIFKQPIPIARARKIRWRPGALIAAAVLMFALLSGMVAWNISLNSQIASLKHQNTLQSVTTYAVHGSNPSSATGQLVYFAQKNITVLIIQGLPQLQGTHIYQGWLLHIKGNDISSGIKDTTSIGVLNVRGDSASLSFPGNVTGYDGTAISLEKGPYATPNAPKGNIVALGSLKQASKADYRNHNSGFQLSLILFNCRNQQSYWL